jgi:hypothetical protein
MSINISVIILPRVEEEITRDNFDFFLTFLILSKLEFNPLNKRGAATLSIMAFSITTLSITF